MFQTMYIVFQINIIKKGTIRNNTSRDARSTFGPTFFDFQEIEGPKSDSKCAVCEKTEGLFLCSGCKVLLSFLLESPYYSLWALCLISELFSILTRLESFLLQR